MKSVLMKFVSLVLFIYANSLNAQVLQWVNSVGSASTGIEEGNSIVTDNVGNVFVGGEFRGSADFDPGPGVATLTLIGTSDAFIAKYNSSGAYQWAYNFGSPAVNCRVINLATDAAGDLYVAGILRGTIDIDPGTNIVNLASSSPSTYDIFVAKFNSAGTYQWGFRIGAGLDDTAGDLLIDNNGNVVLCGFFQNTMDIDPSVNTVTVANAGSYDSFVAKYNGANGNYLSSWTWGGTGSDRCYSIAADAANNIIVGGRFTGTSDFDPSVLTATALTSGAEDAYIVKFSNSGVYNWHVTIGSTAGSEECLSVITDTNNEVYATGNFGNIVDFDPSISSYTLASNGGLDAFIAKYSSVGALQWAFANGSSGADNGSSLSMLNNELFATGNFVNTVDFDPNSSASYTVTSSGNADVYMAKYSLSGNFLSVATIGGTQNDIVKSVHTASNSIYITGNYSGVSDFDSDAAATYTLASVGNADIYFAKYYNCIPGSPSITVNGGAICSGQSFTLNPSGAISYTYSGGNAIVTPTISTTYTITGADVNGCKNSAVAEVTVNALPSLTVASTASVLCIGETATITPSGAQTYTISGGSFVITPSITSTYTIDATAGNGCSASTIFTQTVSACTMLYSENSETSIIKIFPNPALYQVRLSVLNSGNCTITNILGKVISSFEISTGKDVVIDVSALESGLYFIEYNDGITRHTSKLIKQ